MVPLEPALLIDHRLASKEVCKEVPMVESKLLLDCHLEVSPKGMNDEG